MKRPGRRIGTSLFDCAVGTVDERGMATVFDELYAGYGHSSLHVLLYSSSTKTLRLHLGYPEATLRLPLGYP